MGETHFQEFGPIFSWVQNIFRNFVPYFFDMFSVSGYMGAKYVQEFGASFLALGDQPSELFNRFWVRVGSFIALLGVRRSLKIILSHRAPSIFKNEFISSHMDPFQIKFHDFHKYELIFKTTYLNFKFPCICLLNPQGGGRLDAKRHYVIL